MENKKCQVIAVTNFKGGVGKSTVTLNLGSELANRGYKVLLIDFDAQGNLTKYSGVTGMLSTISDALYAMMEKRAVEHPIYPVRRNLDIIGCNSRLAKWIIDIHIEMLREMKLNKYIELIKKDYDYDFILIDTAGDIGIDLQNAIFASDRYLIVSDAEQGGLDGVDIILNVVDRIKEISDHDIRSAGIILNRYEVGTNLHAGMFEVFKECFGRDHHIYQNVIPKAIDIGTSSAYGMPVAEYKKKSRAAKAYEMFADEFLEVMEGVI